MQIAQNNKESKGASRLKGGLLVEPDFSQVPEELLGILLHDLRSPLGAIGVLGDILASAASNGVAPDQRQVAMLQEAVTKAQRIMDDAVEIQSVIRGSSVFTPCVIEMETIVRNSLEKANHAPYFRDVIVDYDSTNGNQLIRVDVEKAESAVLCALEQTVKGTERPLKLQLSHSLHGAFGNVIIAVEDFTTLDEPVLPATPRIFTGMNGRLGTRRLGESRFNLLLAEKVMELLGGHLQHEIGRDRRFVKLQFPISK